MADKKMTQRDATLVSVLERMADHLRNHDLMLEEVISHQSEITKAVHSIEYYRNIQQDENNTAYGKLLDSLNRYRADMLSLVNEQDHLNKNMDDLNVNANKIAYASGNTDSKVVNLSERYKIQEKAVREHYEYALKQAETYLAEIAETNRNFSKLHMDTEKRLGQMHGETQNQLAESNRHVTKQHIDTEKRLVQMHNETQRQLEHMRAETTRRLFALDGIESALQTLLIRTEPPEKKPLWVVRIFRTAGRFCRQKLASAPRIRWPRRKGNDNQEEDEH